MIETTQTLSYRARLPPDDRVVHRAARRVIYFTVAFNLVWFSILWFFSRETQSGFTYLLFHRPGT